MTFLTVILCIVAFFVLDLSIPLKVSIGYDDKISLSVKYLFIKLNILPTDPNKPKKEKKHKEEKPKEEKPEEEPEEEETPIVDYMREAYQHPAENVRITFDMQLRSGLHSVDLFNKNLPTVCPHDQNVEILEVKFDDYLPGHLDDCLADIPKIPMAISKFALCLNLI